MDKQPLLEAITHIKSLEDLSSWDLQTLLADFPYFQTAHLLWAKKAKDTDNYEQQEILQKAAIYAANRAVLYKLMYQKEPIHPSSNSGEETLQMDKKDIPLIITSGESDEQETEVVSVEHLDLEAIEESVADEHETEDISIGHLDLDGDETEVVSVGDLDLPEEEEINVEENLDFTDSDSGYDTEGIEVEEVSEMISDETEEMTILDKLKAEIAEKQKSIELQLKEERDELQSPKSEYVNSEKIEVEDSFNDVVENIPAAIPEVEVEMDEKLEETARSITSSLDKSLLKIAQEDVIEVKDREIIGFSEESEKDEKKEANNVLEGLQDKIKEVQNIPASLDIVETDEDEEDKFALKHIFEPQEGEEDDILSTEQISEEARKRVQEELTAKLKTIDEDAEVPIIESSNTLDLSDMVKKEVEDSIQKDIEELEAEEEEELWEDEEDLKVNSAIIKASIKKDKESLKESLLENAFEEEDDDEEEEENPDHPENEIESDLIMNLKAKVESYKQKKKTFESWLTGDLEKEEQPKVKLSEEDETEIKKFVDYQIEIGNNDKVEITSMDDETPLEATESMAEVYAQQGHYKRALKIYEQLSLKYPEKSSYFAAKIVEIQKKL